MEKARQYSAVAPDERVFAYVYRAGSLVLIAGLSLQALFRIDALFPAIMAVGCTRISLAGWQLLRPGDFRDPPAPFSLLFAVLAWGVTMAMLIWLRLR